MTPRFGVNHTPTQGWFHHWPDVDLDAVRADLDSSARLGLDHVGSSRCGRGSSPTAP